MLNIVRIEVEQQKRSVDEGETFAALLTGVTRIINFRIKSC